MLFTGLLEFLKQFSVFYYDISDSVYLIVVLCCVIHQDVKRVKIRSFCCTNLFLFMLDSRPQDFFHSAAQGPWAPPPSPPCIFSFPLVLSSRFERNFPLSGSTAPVHRHRRRQYSQRGRHYQNL